MARGIDSELDRSLSASAEGSEYLKGKVDTLVRELESTGTEASKEKLLPTHKEIMEAWENQTSKNKMEINQALLNKAFESLGEPPHDLSKAHEITIDTDFATVKREAMARGELKKGEPVFYYKRIDDHATGTHEVRLIVDLNNSDEKDKNTMVTATVELDKNRKIPEFEGRTPYGIFTIKSQSEVEKAFEKVTVEPWPLSKWLGGKDKTKFKNNDPDAKFMRGERNIDDFVFGFEKKYKKPLAVYWQEQDELTVKTEEYKQANEKKAILMEKLGSDYTEVLRDAEETHEQKIDKYRAQVEEFRAKQATIAEQAVAYLVGDMKKLGSESPEEYKERVETFIRITVAFNGDIPEREIRALVKRITG